MSGPTRFRSIRPHVAVLTVALLGASAFGVAQNDAASDAAGVAESVAATVDAEASRLLDARDVTGAAVAVVIDGEIVHAAGYGVADVESGRAVGPDTAFAIGSVTKILTFTAAMTRIEDGDVAMDAPVARYVDVALPGDDPDAIRVRNLFAHDAGFEDRPLIGLLALDEERMRPLRDELEATTPALQRPVGSEPTSSAWGAALAGWVVERSSGTPFDAYVQRRILDPLDMDATSLRQPPDGPDLAVPHVPTDEGFARVATELVPLVPAGGASASARDLARFAAALLNDGAAPDELGGGRILSPESAATMLEPLHLRPDGVSGVAHGLWISESFGMRTVHHQGDTLASHALWLLVPERDAALVVLTNATTGGPFREELRVAFLRALAGDAADDPVAAVAAGVEPAVADTGTYADLYGSSRRTDATVGKLLAVLSGLLPVLSDGDDLLLPLPTGELTRFVAAGADRFVDPVSGGRATFVRDGDRVTSVHLSDAPMFSYRPLRGLDAPTTFLSVLGVAFLASLLTVILWPIGLRRHRRREGGLPGGPRWVRTAAQTTATLIVLFGASLVLVGLAPLALIYGLTLPMLSVLTLGSLLLFAAPLTAFATAYALWRGVGRPADRGWSLLVTVSAVALAVQVVHWNLFGFHV